MLLVLRGVRAFVAGAVFLWVLGLARDCSLVGKYSFRRFSLDLLRRAHRGYCVPHRTGNLAAWTIMTPRTKGDVGETRERDEVCVSTRTEDPVGALPE